MNTPLRRWRLTARVTLPLLVLTSIAVAPTLAQTSPDAPTITFRKIFKSSFPEFVEIKVSQTGAATYDIRQLTDDPSPHNTELAVPLAKKIFDLAGELHNFAGLDLEMHRRIANLGQKTFEYDRGSESHSVTFNYTVDPFATQLLNIFEGLTRQESDLANLQRTMRYDRLGVNDVLLQIERDYNLKVFPQPDQLLPSLDQLAADNHFIDIARERARTLAGRIRSGH